MAPKTPPMKLEEMPGTQYPDLSAAQERALAATASDLATMIRSLLASGALVNQNGKIIPKPKE